MTVAIEEGLRRIRVGATAPDNSLGWVGNHVTRSKLFACHYLGNAYPGPSPLYDYRNSARQIGALTPRNAIFTDTYMDVSAGHYADMPWSAADVAGVNGFSGFYVANFLTMTSTVLGTLVTTETPGFTLATSTASGGYVRLTRYQVGTDATAFILNSELGSYTGTGPEFGAFNLTGEILQLWRKSPTSDLKYGSAAHSIPLSEIGTHPIRVGNNFSGSQTEIDIYAVGLRNDLFENDAEVSALYEELKTFLDARVGVTI